MDPFSHLIYPENSGVERGALVLLEKFEIYVHDVGSLECLHHAKENVDVAGPFALYAWYWYSAESASVLRLAIVIVDVAHETPEYNCGAGSRDGIKTEANVVERGCREEDDERENKNASKVDCKSQSVELGIDKHGLRTSPGMSGMGKLGWIAALVIKEGQSRRRQGRRASVPICQSPK